MGSVNFNTDVDKTVDITKNVFLDVNKDVFSFVDIEGNLATAEASADAVGFGDGTPPPGPVEQERIRLTFDDFEDNQILTVNPPPDNTGTIGPVQVTRELPPLPPEFDFGVTDRFLHTTVLSTTDGTSTGLATIAVDQVAPGKLSFGQDPGTFSNAYAEYTGAGGDPFPFDDNAGILEDFETTVAELFAADPSFDPFTGVAADNPDYQALIEQLCYTYRFEDIDWDPGSVTVDGITLNATLRVSLIVGDGDGDFGVTTVLFVPAEGEGTSGFNDLQIDGIVAGFLTDPALPTVPAPGFVLDEADNGAKIVLLGTNTDIDGDGEVVNFDNLTFAQILLEDDPTTAVGDNATPGGLENFASADYFEIIDDPLDPFVDSTGDIIIERPSRDGTDASVGEFSFTTCIEQQQPPDFGLLAETDTFAQVSPDGAFSFSESLAASSPVVVEDNIDIA